MQKNSVTRSLSFFLVLTLLLILGSNAAIADQYHYNNMLIGNRASGLAGSYVAISDDPSGLYYNPSGVIYSTTSNITANMNAYNYSKTVYKGALTKANGEKVDYIRTSSALVPNFFGITQPLGPGVVGFSYAITDSILEDQSQTFDDVIRSGIEYTLNINNQDATNNIGPSYAMTIGDKFSVGLTLYGVFRSQKFIFNRIVNIPGPTDINGFLLTPFKIDSNYVAITEYGTNPILGFSYSPMEKLSLGLTFSKAFIFDRIVSNQTNVINGICLDPDDATKLVICPSLGFKLTKTTDDTRLNKPWKINFGGAYFYSNSLMLTANIWFHESTLSSRPTSGSALHDAIHYTFVPLVNVAGGIEYYITGKIALRLGAYTNLSNTALKPNNDESEHIDIIGTTMSLTHFTRASAISVGTALTMGTGESKLDPGSIERQNVEYYGLSVFLSASNSF